MVPVLPNENTGFVVGALDDSVSVAEDVANDTAEAEEAKLNGPVDVAAFEAGMFSLPAAGLMLLAEDFLSLSFSFPLLLLLLLLLLGAAKLSPVLMLPPFGVGFIAGSTAAAVSGVMVVCPKEKLPWVVCVGAGVAWTPNENAFVFAVDVPNGLIGCCFGC